LFVQGFSLVLVPSPPGKKDKIRSRPFSLFSPELWTYASGPTDRSDFTWAFCRYFLKVTFLPRFPWTASLSMTPTRMPPSPVFEHRSCVFPCVSRARPYAVLESQRSPKVCWCLSFSPTKNSSLFDPPQRASTSHFVLGLGRETLAV